jgi:hypothetical protein
MKYLHQTAIILLLIGCTPQKETEPTFKNGIIKVYRDDRRLHKELAYKNDSLHGLSKVYHPNGKLYLETEWANNKRHGITKQYFQSGILYSETQYDSGRITGILRKYHKDGKLKAEVPYNKGIACAGLKEYLLNGEPRPYYPSIVIKTEDKIKTEGYYYLNFSISERVRKVTFYRGTLKDNCLHSELEKIYQPANDKAMLVYPMGRGQYVDQAENFIAKIETIAGNMLVVQKSFHVKIHREF